MISIITSLYNSQRHLPLFIKKIEKVSGELIQQKIEHEFLLISNSPNDQEKKLLTEIEANKKISSRIIICDRESLYATWNRGINEAKFPIITFWNVDDIRFTEGIIDGLSKINDGAGVVYFPFVYKRYVKILNIPILVKRVVIDPPKFDLKTFSEGMHCGPFFMTTKKSFEKIGTFDATFKIAGDFDWCVRAAKSGLVFKKSNVIAGIFTNDGTTLSGSKNKIQADENSRIIKKI
jgi:glycosyltransferase involved in cell wall biosynthesis